METWYRTGKYSDNLIDEVCVIKSTDKTVTVREKDWRGKERDLRCAIVSGGCQYFKTWEEAHACALNNAVVVVESLRRQLERANGRLGNIRGLTKPDKPPHAIPHRVPAESGATPEDA